MRARDPRWPRDYIDGQVYALYPVLEETIVVPGDPYPFNQWNFISLLVWSGSAPDEPPTWHGDVESVLRQCANRYPVMRDFLDLGAGDPDSMPVARDLSAKRQTILRWLSEPGEDGKPLLGSPPAGPSAAESVPAAARAGVIGDPSGGARAGGAPPHGGGKAAAASRRPAARRRTAAVGGAAMIRVHPEVSGPLQRGDVHGVRAVRQAAVELEHPVIPTRLAHYAGVAILLVYPTLDTPTFWAKGAMMADTNVPFQRLVGQTEKTLNAILDKVLAGTVSERQWVALVVIAGGGPTGDHALAQVARVLKTDQRGAADHIAALAALGLVATGPSGTVVTADGQRLIDRVQAQVGEITQRLWGDIPAADMAVVRRVLGTVLERAEAELSAASPGSPASSAGR
jgi:DNA-binding MarR family transcriptional regulator